MDRIYRIAYKGSVVHAVDRSGRLCPVEGDVFGDYRVGDPIAEGYFPRDLPPDVRLLAPVLPSKIVAIGLNYRDHAAEQSKPAPTEPVIFIKPATAVVGPGDPIRLPSGVGRIDYETEVGVVIGKRASRVPRERAMDYVLGYTCVNDVTARDLQRRGFQYSHCKGYDTFAPVGPCIAVGLDGANLTVEGFLNDERRQASTTAQLIFPVEELIAYVTNIMTLEPGDIISTGTPSGIGVLSAGDTFTVRVEGVGDLTNPVEARD
jgi:2-keto-4-pentenoate hydratase/2-oxohepta-3-ene-1,7-dioic acid hydratase in catechol pathway